MTPEFIIYMKKVQRILQQYITLPRTPCANCTKFIKCNDKEFLTFNTPCLAYSPIKGEREPLNKEQHFLIEVLNNDKADNDKPETFIKLIKQNLNKLKLPENIKSQIFNENVNTSELKETQAVDRERLKKNLLENLKKYKNLKEAAKRTGISESLPHNWRRTDKIFDQKFKKTYNSLYKKEKQTILENLKLGIPICVTAEKLGLSANEVSGWMKINNDFVIQYNKIKENLKCKLTQELEKSGNFLMAVEQLNYDRQLCVSYRDNDKKFADSCDKIIKSKQQQLLDNYKKKRDINYAIQATGINEKTFRHWLRHYHTFTQQFNTITSK